MSLKNKSGQINSNKFARVCNKLKVSIFSTIFLKNFLKTQKNDFSYSFSKNLILNNRIQKEPLKGDT